MKMTFSSEITAADTETRTITGLIVPFGPTGNTSAGAVVFEPGSITIRAGKTKLFADHDNRQVLGSMISHEITTAGIMASFKIANTTAGNDALELAASGLKSGLSVGVDVKAGCHLEDRACTGASAFERLDSATELHHVRGRRCGPGRKERGRDRRDGGRGRTRPS